MTNLDVAKENDPDTAYSVIERIYQGWIDEANKLFGLAGDEPTDDWSMNIWNEAYGYFMKADLFAIDHAPFILKYQKDHPEIKDRFFSDEGAGE